ncbi:ATP-binding protein [Candidatus Albibeggiatoa sp. nov. NOAA]|uniref:ATP-binding protein n=1 Tax=Candidatus Albibeggiatoa sp. nov. NOAA TaxID=3162724 RepID=UPI003300C078|nr:ATP-binding protein [Thiotrichaceae bacterium]
MQVHPVRRATQAIAITPKLAIDFCQTIAEETNSKTLLSLSVNSPLARSFAIITPEPEKDEQIYIWAGSFPPKHSQIEWYQIFHDTSQMNLQTQLRYSLDNLKQYKHYKGYQQLNEQFQQWLKYSRATNLSQLIEIAELQSKNTQGYSQQAVNLLRQQLKDLPKYIKLEAINARREFLNQQKEHLSSLTYGEIPNYWKNLAQRVNQHWQTILEQEAEQAKDILKLDIQLTQNNLVLGQQTLNFKIYSTALAQNICLKINDHAHIFWNHNEVKRDILEAGRDTQLQLTADIKQAGNHTINGILSAQDTNDIEIQHPFSFQILVATKGKPYQIPELAPYTVGTRLNSDTTFTGRSDLINWLTGLWKHPEKSAIVLIGQRRIGKSSLLTKLKRDYQNLSNAAPLIPIFVDIQDVNSDYSFFKTASREMATALKQPVPHISREEPIEDFKDFLFSLELQNQKFLLMIDEADLMPSKKFSADLFHMLRSLMQGEQYPVLVLFCGTYQLQRLAWDYASIFFNTTLMRPVSYLSHNESNELLTRPATDILEYDETALNHAYELTNGHPYLLQKLGSILIEHYNDCVTYGEQRSNYVGYQDIDFIADKLIKASDNAAFIEHWKNSDLATKQILSTLATQTNETNRRQLTIESLSLKLKQEDMPLLSQQIVDIIKQQVKETILKPQGQGYSFVVPLQRRWIEWEYPIKDVRLMLDK